MKSMEREERGNEMERQIAIRSWEHPGTGEIRLYVNGHSDASRIRAWFTLDDEGGIIRIAELHMQPIGVMSFRGVDPQTYEDRIIREVAEATGINLNANDAWDRLLQAAE
jgi:hypothetical protein